MVRAWEGGCGHSRSRAGEEIKTGEMRYHTLPEYREREGEKTNLTTFLTEGGGRKVGEGS